MTGAAPLAFRPLERAMVDPNEEQALVVLPRPRHHDAGLLAVPQQPLNLRLAGGWDVGRLRLALCRRRRQGEE